MAFKLNIKNIGKLTDAKIDIGQFTVFAGPNNTGKSFVSKLLYSLFDAMNANHAEVYIQNLTKPVRNSLRRLMRRDRSAGSDVLYSFLMKEIKNLENAFKDSTIEDNEGMIDKAIHDFADSVENIRERFPYIRPQIESMTRQQILLFPSRTRTMMEDILKNAEQSLTKLHKQLNSIDAEECITAGIEYKVRENLTQNFQVSSLTDLQSREDVPSEVNIEGFGKFEFKNAKIRFNIDRARLWELQQYSDVIYLESPVYWKLKNALENLRIRPRYLLDRKERLSGVPGYFYDLAGALKYEYTGDVGFQSLSEKINRK